MLSPSILRTSRSPHPNIDNLWTDARAQAMLHVRMVWRFSCHICLTTVRFVVSTVIQLNLIISLKHSDVKFVKYMATGGDATAPIPGTKAVPIVTVLESPRATDPPSVWNKHRDEVRDLLSRGRVVAVLGGVHDGPSYSFDQESLISIIGRQDQDTLIQWQCGS